MNKFFHSLISNNLTLSKKYILFILIGLNGFIYQACAPKHEETVSLSSTLSSSYNLQQLNTVSKLIIMSMPAHPARDHFEKLIKKNRKAIKSQLQKECKTDIDDDQLKFLLEELYKHWSKLTGIPTADLKARNEKLLTIRACQSLFRDQSA